MLNIAAQQAQVIHALGEPLQVDLADLRQAVQHDRFRVHFQAVERQHADHDLAAEAGCQEVEEARGGVGVHPYRLPVRQLADADTGVEVEDHGHRGSGPATMLVDHFQADLLFVVCQPGGKCKSSAKSAPVKL